MGEERRLAAIVAADVSGYSRLMGINEEGTFRSLKTHMRELIDPKISEYGGRIVKTTGDGMLSEFNSVVDAVRCCLEIQNEMLFRNKDTPVDKRIEFRIGINVGDIIVEEDDIFGDGVNVAARVEGLAKPGGICVSGAAYDHIAGKVDATFDDLGPQSVKNIPQPVRVLRVQPEDTTHNKQITDVSSPVPGFQGRPAIAVLPFDNLSDDPEQDYFADGIAEDILTHLAMWRWCPIVARNSSFAFKGKNIDVRRIGRELGARYILEGSVRKSTDRVRITGQLIDAETGHHIWADRYDRNLDDIFALQDEIVDKITLALEPAVGQAETQRVSLKRPANLDAWEAYHRGVWHWSRATVHDLKEARDFLTRAIQLDSSFALPHSALAIVATFEVLFAASKDPRASLQEAVREAQIAIKLDPMDAFAHVGLCQALIFIGQHDEAIAAGGRAIELNPSLAIAHHVHGVALFFSGNGNEAVSSISRGIRLSPNDVLLPYFFMGLGAANLTAKNYIAAVEATTTSIGLKANNPLALRFHVSALALAGRLDDAKAALDRVQALAPELSREMLRQATPYRNDADFEHYAEGLRKAGWTV